MCAHTHRIHQRDRLCGIPGARICIVNNTTSTYAIDVKWTEEQSFDRQGPIIGGVTACGQGYDSTKATNWGDAAAGILAPSPQLRMLVAANNPAAGPPNCACTSSRERRVRLSSSAASRLTIQLVGHGSGATAY